MDSNKKELNINTDAHFFNEKDLLQNGGLVKGEEGSVMEKIPVFIYIILVLSFCMFAVVLSLFFISGVQKNIEWYQCCGLISVSGIIFSLSYFLCAYISKKSYYVRPADMRNTGNINSANGIGLQLLGSFRPVGFTKVYYEFFTLIVPIVPLGCYRVEEYPNGTWRRRSYKIYGSEKWNFLEIMYIYLSTYSGVAFLCGIIWLISLTNIFGL